MNGDVNWTAVVAVIGAAVVAPTATVIAAWMANRGKRREEARLAGQVTVVRFTWLTVAWRGWDG